LILTCRYHKRKIVKGSLFQATLTKQDSKELYYVSKLTVLNAEGDDEGEYKAVAKNSEGEATAVVNLNFEGGGKFK